MCQWDDETVNICLAWGLSFAAFGKKIKKHTHASMHTHLPRTLAGPLGDWCFQFSLFDLLQCPKCSVFSVQSRECLQNTLVLRCPLCSCAFTLLRYWIALTHFPSSLIRTFKHLHCFLNPRWPQCHCGLDRAPWDYEDSADPRFSWSGCSVRNVN